MQNGDRQNSKHANRPPGDDRRMPDPRSPALRAGSPAWRNKASLPAAHPRTPHAPRRPPEDDGEDPGPAHPMVNALRNARDLEAIMKEHGTMMAAFVDEDAVMRGEMEAPGPPVREVSPGRYE